MITYWFPFALALVLWRLTSWGKDALWTDVRARTSRFAWAGRATLPLHAPTLGAAIGAIPNAPWPEAVAYPWTIAAGAAVGVVCAWVVTATRHWIGQWGSRPSKLPPPPAGGEG